jgi:hypothetical protein
MVELRNLELKGKSEGVKAYALTPADRIAERLRGA